MKRIFLPLAIISAISCPVLAQELGDITDGAHDQAMQLRSEVSDTVASIPAGIPPVADDIVAAGATASPLGLNFTDDQLEKIAKLKDDFRDSAGAKMVELHSLARKQKELLTQEKVDKSQVLDLQNKINSLKTDLANAHLNMKLDTLALLTSEQKAKLHHRSLERQVFGPMKSMRMHHHRRHGGPATPPSPGETGSTGNAPSLPPA